MLYPPASLGVVGSGQLGRMFIQAAQRMGYRAGVLATQSDDPAAQLAHWRVIGSSDDLATLREFAAQADAVTVEFENVLGPRAALARPRASRAPRLANGLDLPESASRKTVPRPHQPPHTPWRAVRSEPELETPSKALACR